MRRTICIAVATALSLSWGAQTESYLQRCKDHESPAVRAAAERVESGVGDKQELMKAEEAWLLSEIKKTYAQHEDQHTVRGAEPYLHLLERNLRSQLFLVDLRNRMTGASGSEREQAIKDRLEEGKWSDEPVDGDTFASHIAEIEKGRHPGLLRVFIRSRRAGILDVLHILELEEELLRIRLTGILFRGAAQSVHTGQLEENLKRQLQLAKARFAKGAADECEVLCLQEKVDSWFGGASAQVYYKNHECPEVRELAEKYEHGVASQVDILKAEEIWLLGMLMDSARTERPISVEESKLLEVLQENLLEQTTLKDDPSLTEDQKKAKLLTLKKKETGLRTRLIWFPVPQGAEELENQLRQNLRCRLSIIEEQLKSGVGSTEARAEILGKLALCPVSGERDDTPASDAELKARFAALEKNPIPMIQEALGRYRAAAMDMIQLLETEATLLHIRIMARAVLPHVPAQGVDYLVQLEANLTRQLWLAEKMHTADAAVLREKLDSWFPKSKKVNFNSTTL